ncbi:MAG: hypothetical protein Q9P90_04955, partial [candidate division KSB1 bacterium]|nr:hypothetical protein [candidate division KSB1 bacterium]
QVIPGTEIIKRSFASEGNCSQQPLKKHYAEAKLLQVPSVPNPIWDGEWKVGRGNYAKQL